MYMTELEVSRVAAIVKILKDTSHYHCSSFADVDISLLLKLLKTWPPAMIFPGMCWNYWSVVSHSASS